MAQLAAKIADHWAPDECLSSRSTGFSDDAILRSRAPAAIRQVYTPEGSMQKLASADNTKKLTPDGTVYGDMSFDSESSQVSAAPLWGSMAQPVGRACRATTVESLRSLTTQEGASVQKMREEREHQLTSSFSGEVDEGFDPLSPGWLRRPAASVLPEEAACEAWSEGAHPPSPAGGSHGRSDRRRLRHWHQASRLVKICITVLVLRACGVERFLSEEMTTVLKLEVLCDFMLHVGALCGILALRGTDPRLINYVQRQKMMPRWSATVKIYWRILAIVWLMSAANRFAVLLFFDTDPGHGSGAFGLSTQSFSILKVVAHLWSLGILLSVLYSVIQVSSALSMLVDAYCFATVDYPTRKKGVTEWNVLQAVLRKVAGTVELAFILLKSTMVLYVLTSVAVLVIYGMPVVWLFASAILIAFCNVMMFCTAAQVTEKCNRVPALLNSLSCGDRKVDESRHHLVEYVIYSAAGFYVCDVRLTVAMALKLCYMSGVVAFGILTKLTAGF